MRTQRVLLALAAITGLAGCASMSESECRVADWGRVGYTDGVRGDSESRVAAYPRIAARSASPPMRRPTATVGMLALCSSAPPINGWQQGQRGHSGKLASCQGQAGYALFAQYFDAGMQVYRTREDMERNNREVHRLQKRLEESTKDDEKRKLRDELRDLDHQQFHLRNRLAQQQMLRRSVFFGGLALNQFSAMLLATVACHQLRLGVQFRHSLAGNLDTACRFAAGRHRSFGFGRGQQLQNGDIGLARHAVVPGFVAHDDLQQLFHGSGPVAVHIEHSSLGQAGVEVAFVGGNYFIKLGCRPRSTCVTSYENHSV